MAGNGSVSFPFEEDLIKRSLKRTTSINDTIATAIRAFLLTVPGQRRGNQIGSILTSFKHKLIPPQALPGIADEIKQELVTQFPGVTFPTVTLEQSVEDNIYSLILKITFSTLYTNIEELVVLV